MAKEYVQSIFIKQLTAADFWHGERGPHTDEGQGGSGQTYFDVPLGNITAQRLALFLEGNIAAGQAWPRLPITAAALGAPGVVAELVFGPRENNGRYKINNQTRRRGTSQRHPAWTPAYGFPEIPDALALEINDKEDNRISNVSSVKLMLVKTFEGRFYASFINTGVMPASWPVDVGFERMFQAGFSADMIDFAAPKTPLSPAAQDILSTWRNGKKNVLLYGPSGTGKTHLMQELWQFLTQGSTGTILTVDPGKPVQTAFSAEDADVFATPVRCDWVTFHQNFSYEQFILALRPEPVAGGGVTLKPKAGVLLDAAMSLHEGRCKTAILFVDEVNRGNVSRIFGEFITFMDDDYRAESDGSHARALPVPFGSVRYQGDKTEPIERLHSKELSLPLPWYFPRNLYILASMNSVDRAVAPLDTALARRFARIEVPPDMEALARQLGISDVAPFFHVRRDGSAEEEEASEGDEEQADGNTQAAAIPRDAVTVSYLLLYRLNYILAETLGVDFEIGHTYLFAVGTAVTEEERWLALSRAWDQAIYPQLRERYNNRPEVLANILRADGKGLLKERRKPAVEMPANVGGRRILDMPSLEAAFKAGKHNDVKRVLIRLAGL